MILVDVHAHLDFPEFSNDVQDVIERSKAAGVAAIICQGVHTTSNANVLELATRYPLLKPAMGVYPLNLPNVRVNDEQDKDFDRKHAATIDETLQQIKQHAHKIVAIGEVGIDLHFSDDREHQVANFTRILQLANQLHKPVIIHSRKAEKLILDILEDAKFTNAVLHCFNGGKGLIKRAVDNGLALTVTSNANRLQHFQMLAKMVPLGQLLTETDAPYLSPVVGERNEPQNVSYAIDVIAQQKGLNNQEVARAIFMNYQKRFL